MSLEDITQSFIQALKEYKTADSEDEKEIAILRMTITAKHYRTYHKERA